jgi:hypothetical protein
MRPCNLHIRPLSCGGAVDSSCLTPRRLRIRSTWTNSRFVVEDIHEPRLKVKDENVGWKHTCSRCSHAGFERIGSRSGCNPVEDIYILQRPSSCDPHFRYSESRITSGKVKRLYAQVLFWRCSYAHAHKGEECFSVQRAHGWLSHMHKRSESISVR